MIVHNNHIKIKTLDSISSSKNCTYYRVLPTGELQINGYFKSHVYLAYVRGNWFASYGTRKSASMPIPENGLDLFVHSNNSIWIQNDNNDVDLSSADLPLDEGTYFALFAFSGSSYDVIMADGSKYSTVISTCLKKTPENVTFLAFALASFIRQYDDNAADKIMEFWFSKNTSNNDRKDYRPQLQFRNQENRNEAEISSSDTKEEPSISRK